MNHFQKTLYTISKLNRHYVCGPFYSRSYTNKSYSCDSSYIKRIKNNKVYYST